MVALFFVLGFLIGKWWVAVLAVVRPRFTTSVLPPSGGDMADSAKCGGSACSSWRWPA
jgi:hypothetical protein